jgi:hypothetical protein
MSVNIPGFNVISAGDGGTLLGFKSGVKFRQILNLQVSSCELNGAEVEDAQGQKLSIISVYCSPNWSPKSQQVDNALASMPHPILVMGDFYTHSRSWGCEPNDSRASSV